MLEKLLNRVVWDLFCWLPNLQNLDFCRTIFALVTFLWHERSSSMRRIFIVRKGGRSNIVFPIHSCWFGQLRGTSLVLFYLFWSLFTSRHTLSCFGLQPDRDKCRTGRCAVYALFILTFISSKWICQTIGLFAPDLGSFLFSNLTLLIFLLFITWANDFYISSSFAQWSDFLRTLQSERLVIRN